MTTEFLKSTTILYATNENITFSLNTKSTTISGFNDIIKRIELSTLTDISENDWDEFFKTLSKIFSVILILICIVGAIMNAISLWIFTRRDFRNLPINLLLAGLSASDVCLCVLAIPAFTFTQIQQMFPNFIRDEVANPINALNVYTYTITLMAQTSSVWMLVCITIERWLAVCHPFRARASCTRKRALLTIVICMLFSIGYNFIRFWEYTIETQTYENGTKAYLIAGLLRENYYFMILYQNIALLVTQFIIPLSVLIGLNFQVVRTILEASKTRRELGTNEQREHRTAKMMFFVVVVFLCCYSLGFFLNIMETFNKQVFKRSFGQFLNDLNNVLVVINSSTSCIFYMIYSSRYIEQLRVMRRQIKWIFCRYFCCGSVSSGDIYSYPFGRRDLYKNSSITFCSGAQSTTIIINNSYNANNITQPLINSNLKSDEEDSVRKNSDFAASIIHKNNGIANRRTIVCKSIFPNTSQSKSVMFFEKENLHLPTDEHHQNLSETKLNLPPKVTYTKSDASLSVVKANEINGIYSKPKNLKFPLAIVECGQSLPKAASIN